MPATALATPTALKSLAIAIGRACGRDGVADGPAMLEALRVAVRAPELLDAAHRAGSDAGYVRHVVHADPQDRFTVLALVWRPGQFSPVHWHHSWCAYAVVSGVLQETGYQWDQAGDEAGGRATASMQRARREGDASFAIAGSTRIHRLGNSSGREAISLHVYGVAAGRITTGVNRIVEPSAVG
jgi:predicted metal-dependent enzyme (double-stranded beta helix superfamily)